MKKFLLTGVIFLMVFVSVQASAFDAKKLSINGKPVEVLDVSVPWLSFNDDVKIEVKKTPKLFVIAYSGVVFKGWLDERLINADQIIRTVFERHGFVVVNTPEEADLAVALGVTGAFEGQDANEAAGIAFKSSGELGATAGHILAGGPIALIAELGFLGRAKKSLVVGHVYRSPKSIQSHERTALVSGIGEGSAREDSKRNVLSIEYKLGKDSHDQEATAAEVFEVLVEEWASRYLVTN